MKLAVVVDWVFDKVVYHKSIVTSKPIAMDYFFVAMGKPLRSYRLRCRLEQPGNEILFLHVKKMADLIHGKTKG